MAYNDGSKNIKIFVQCFAPNSASLATFTEVSPSQPTQYQPETEWCLEKKLANSGYWLKSLCSSLSWDNFWMHWRLNNSLDCTGICMEGEKCDAFET